MYNLISEKISNKTILGHNIIIDWQNKEYVKFFKQSKIQEATCIKIFAGNTQQ